MTHLGQFLPMTSTFRFRLRTLLILLAIGPPILAWQYSRWQDDRLWQSLSDAKKERDTALVEWRRTYDAMATGRATTSHECAAQTRYYAARAKVETAAQSLMSRYGDEQRLATALHARRRK